MESSQLSPAASICNPDHMADYGSKPSESGEASVAPRPQAILLCQALVNLAWTFGCEFL